MKLHSPTLEREVRRRARRIIKASPPLKREARRHKKPVHLRVTAAVRLVPTLLLAVNVGHDTLSFEARMGLITLWSLFLVFSRAHGLMQSLYRSPDLAPLIGLPFPAWAIFRWESQKFLRSSAWAFFDFCAAYIVLFSGVITHPLMFAVLVAGAAAQTLLIVLAATALVSWRRSGWYQLVMLFGILLAFVVAFTFEFTKPFVISVIEAISPTINRWLPFGVLTILLKSAAAGSLWDLLLLALLGIATAALFLIVWRKLSHQYQLDAQIVESIAADRSVTDEDGKPAPTGPFGEVLPPAALSAREFLRSLPFEQEGVLERWLCRLLTPRERTLLEAMAGDSLRLTRRWKRAAIWTSVGLLSAGLIHFTQPQNESLLMLIFFAFAGILAIIGFSMLGGINRLQRPAFMSGVSIPLYAGLPVGFREMGVLIQKTVLVRLLAHLPLVMIYGATMAHWFHVPPGEGARLSFVAIYFLAALSPMFTTLRFSSGSDDSQRFRLMFLLLLAIAIPAALLFLGLTAGLIAGEGVVAWLCGIGLPLPSIGLFCAYRWMFNRCSFDLMQQPRG